MIPQLQSLTVSQAAVDLAAGSYTSVQLTQAALEQIAIYNPRLNAVVHIATDLALQQAAESDARRASGSIKGPLDGIPYTLKDVFVTTDMPITTGSRMLEGWISPYNATAYQNLCEAGAVCLGTANTDEFTMGGSTERSAWGVTHNPWDLDRVAGGSSGGSAAAVAAGFGLFSVGTDTGGSIRQPAAFCGVTGLKPTYGRISRFGQIPMASSFDQAGVITKVVEDTALVLQVLAGWDPQDAMSLTDAPPEYAQAFTGSIKGVRIAVPNELVGRGGVHEGQFPLLDAALATLEEQGAVIVRYDSEQALRSLSLALAVYYILVPAEISSNMARYDGIRYGYSIERNSDSPHSLLEVYTESRGQSLGEEVQRRIMMGAHVLSSGYHDAYYRKALAVQDQIRAEFTELFQQCDIVLGLVTPGPAFGIGEKIDDPLALYREDILTTPANIAGLPAMSIPMGLLDGLPVGMQLIGPHLGESVLLQVAHAFQQRTSHHTVIPNLYV